MIGFLNGRNKLLLLNIRQIRKESMTNLQAPSYSFIRINDAITLDNADTANVIHAQTNSRSVYSKKRSPTNRIESTNETSANSTKSSKHPVFRPVSSSSSSSAHRSNSPSSPLSDKPTAELLPKGSFSPVPESDSSGSFIYQGFSSNISLSNPRSSSPQPSKPARATLYSQVSSSSLSQQSISFNSRSPEEEWTISPRTKLQILFLRIVYCLQRNPMYLYLHNGAALLIAASLGISFWQLPQDTMGISRRYSLLITIVLYLIIQGLSGRIWFRKDREVFIRDIRCGYYSPLEYFFVVILLDGIFIRFLPSILFVEMNNSSEL